MLYQGEIMDFTFTKEKDGWALITHANGEQYRIEYNVGDRELQPGLCLFISDGFAPVSVHQQIAHIALIRLELLTDCNADNVVDTATHFMDAHGLPCLSPDHRAVICTFSHYDENGDWVMKDNGTGEEIVLNSAKQQFN